MAQIVVSTTSRKGVDYSSPSSVNLAVALLAGMVCTANCNFNSLYVTGAAPTSGEDTTFTLYKNGVATLLLAQLASDSVSAVDFTHDVACVAGDVVTLKRVDSAGSATQAVNIQIVSVQ